MRRYHFVLFAFSVVFIFATFSILSAETWQDECGYQAADTNDGATYEWIDITANGIEVTDQLEDDNVIGPFNIGFDFPYYWYTVDQFWIGANGYIIFRDDTMLAAPFPVIPNVARPQNYIAVYAADHDPSELGGGECWYYYDEANHRLIVSYIQMEAYALGGSHTFQLILYDNGIIKFNYQEDVGTFNQENGDWVTIGIESVTGQVGIQNYHDVQPGAPYAIEFHRSDPVLCEVHDVAVDWVLTEGNLGEFSLAGQSSPFSTSIVNIGTEPKSNITVTARVLKGFFLDPDWEDNQTIPTLAPGESVVLTFSGWTPSEEDIYAIRVVVDVDPDDVPANNTETVEYTAIDYSGGTTLSFVDDTNEDDINWTGGAGSGVACQFPVPLATRLNTVYFYHIPATDPTFITRIYDDSDNGMPGNMLVERELNASPVPGWVEMDVSGDNIIISEGSFFVVYIQNGDDPGRFGMDQSTVISRRAFEYHNGTFSRYRDKDVEDVMMRVDIETGEFGTISGTVTDDSSSEPLAANVRAEGIDGIKSTVADANGNYSIMVSPGEWTIYAELFGYENYESNSFTVNVDAVIEHDIDMTALPTGTLQGTVADAITDNGISGATVSLVGLPIDDVTTDSNGFYSFGEVFANYEYTINCSAPNYSEETTLFTVTPDQVNTLNFGLQFIQSFEEDGGDFSGTGEWEHGIPLPAGGPSEAYDGDNCWGTDLDGFYYGPTGMFLTTPEYSLTGVAPYELHFHHWLECDATWDGGNVQISLDGGATWTVIEPVGGYPDNSVPGLSSDPGYSGSFDWAEAVFDLNSYADNQHVTFRFRFGTTMSRNLRGWFIDSFYVLGHDPTESVEDENNIAVPTAYDLAQNYPNPFNPITTIKIALPTASTVSLNIYDVTGRLVRSLSHRQLDAGYHDLEWNGTNNDGHAVGSGVYFYRIETDNFSDTKQMILLK